MPTTSSFKWHPERLNAAIVRAFADSLKLAAADANANSPETDGASAAGFQTGPTSGVLKATGPLGPILEAGARPHTETGTKGFLYINGAYVSGTIHHPGSPPKPYVGPAAARWAAGGFNTTAKVVLAGSGF